MMNAGSAREMDSAEFANELPADGTPAALFDHEDFGVSRFKDSLRTTVQPSPAVRRGLGGLVWSSDLLRRSARCTDCGAKGATLQHPS
jgi:hypothetical protein